MELKSKLPDVGTTIFTVMSALANKHGAINLSQGFPNYSSNQELIDLVHYYMNKGLNQYAPMQGVSQLNEVLANKMETLYQKKINPSLEITITAGATQGLYTAISAFVHPGDEVIVIEPAYDSYVPAIKVNGGIPVIYEMVAPKYKIDWSAIDQLVNAKTKMIIINTPHNPTATVFSEKDMKALEKIVSKWGILVLSDEVYEHLIYDNQEHESVLKYPGIFDHSIAAYSFGKTFHNTGWKLGYVVGPALLMEEFRKVHQFNVFTCNTPMQYALADYLKNAQAYQYLPTFYQEKRDLFGSLMADSSLNALHCKGTYFQLFDYSGMSDLSDFEFCKWLTTKIGVAAIPVSVFYSSRRDDQVIRFCFAKTEDILRSATIKLNNIKE